MQSQFRETMVTKGGEIIERVKELIRAGNVRRVIIKQDDRTVAEFPLTAGVVGALIAPQLAAIGAVAALLTGCTIEIERADIRGEAAAPVEANKALARRYIEDVWGKGDFAAEREVIAPDLIDHHPQPGQAPGLEGHHQTLTQFYNAFSDVRFTLEDLIGEADKVVGRWTLQATQSGTWSGIPPTGWQVTITGIGILRIEGGKIREIWHQEDLLGLLQQLGAFPSPGPTTG